MSEVHEGGIVRPAFLAIAAIHVAGQIIVWLPYLWANADVLALDARQLHMAAERVREGAVLYWPWPDFGPHYNTAEYPYPPERIPYPPVLPALLSFLPPMSFHAFARGTHLALLACFWGYAVCLAKLAAGRISLAAVGICGFVLMIFPGTRSAIEQGNVDPLLWLLLGMALVSVRARGAAFACASAVKVYGVWPLAFAACRDRRRVVVGAGVAAVASGAVMLLAMGPAGAIENVQAWFAHVMPVIGQGTFRPFNVSLSFAVIRLAVWAGWEFTPGPLPAIARIYLMAVGIAAPLIAGWLTRRSPAPMQYAIVSCAAVLIAPLCWRSYLPILLAPAALMWHSRMNEARRQAIPYGAT
jgi:hypothetical protein